FFFQAEDGIRDRTVTGVQTCALPISGAPARTRCTPYAARAYAPSGCGRRPCVTARGPAACRDPCLRSFSAQPLMLRHGAADENRSEERRVGKEWRSRWAADP